MTPDAEEVNPYAAPQAELRLPRIVSGPARFYPMSPVKAALMSILTMGMYDVLFWYRHWTRQKDSGQDVHPLLRTFFMVFTSFGFVTTLKSTMWARGLTVSTALRYAPAVYFGLTVVSRAADKALKGPTALLVSVVASAGGAWVLFTVQRGANDVLAHDEFRGPVNSDASPGAILSGLIGLFVWLFVVIFAANPEAFE